MKNKEYFQNFQSIGCCLCGDINSHTREHKFKKSEVESFVGIENPMSKELHLEVGI